MPSRPTFLLLFGLLAPRVAAQSVFPFETEKLRHAREVEREARLKKDTLLLAEAYYLYGKMYVAARDYAVGKTYFLKSLRLLEPRGDSYELGRLYIRLSENPNTFHTAEEIGYARRADAIFKRIESAKGQALASTTLGQIYERLHPRQKGNREPDSTLFFLKKAEKLNLQLQDTLGDADVALKIGELYLSRRDPRAVGYLEKALWWLHWHENASTYINTSIRLSQVYLDEGRFSAALAKTKEAERHYDDHQIDNHLLAASLDQAMIAYYEKTGQWQSAFERFRRMYSRENAELNAQKESVLSRLQVEYETEKKEAQLKNQERELKLTNENLRQQRLFVLIVSLLFLVAGILSVLFFRLSRKYRRISRQNKSLLLDQRHQSKNNHALVLSLLRAQVGRLSDPQSKQAAEETRLRVEAMSSIHRRLFEDDSQTVELSQYITEVVSDILYAFGYDHIAPDYWLDPIELDAKRTLNLGLILTELVTNACKYAFPDHPNPTLVVSCQQRGKSVELVVADNGAGFDFSTVSADSFDSSTSLGMSLIQIQVEQLNGKFAFSNQGGTTFTMTFKVQLL